MGCTHVVSQSGINAPDLCVRAATTITINVTQTITGVRPLVLVAADTLTIDTNGALLYRPAPNTTGKYCPTASDGPNAGATSAGGGAGGSFGGRGGIGGASDGNVVAAATATVSPSFVRGGCPGGRGGALGVAPRAPAGYGGGAIYLLAQGTVAIAGFVDAAGGGGQGGASMAAGGGSGGLIVVDAQNIDFKAVAYLLASGGGGGAGFGPSTGDGGKTAGRYMPVGTGGLGVAVGVNVLGSGGDGSGFGLEGGAGSRGDDDTGAGGGGGGAGWIRFYSQASTIDGTGIYPPLQ